MGRETRILLGLLGLLAGLFVGVLSLKLLVPRPPTGAGPDVHGDVVFQVPQEIVDPPAPGPRVWGAGVPRPQIVATVVPLPAAEPPQADQSPDQDDLGSAPEFAVEPALTMIERDVSPATVDPFVTAAGLNQPVDAPPPGVTAERVEPAPDEPAEPPADATAASDDVIPTSRFSRFDSPGEDRASPAAFRTPVEEAGNVDAWPAAGREPPPFAREQPVVDAAAGPIAGSHVVAAGDSWWSVAERAYGDGRHYRALFAWNRALDPRIALAPGTPLQVPPREQLEAAWPQLIPTGR